MTISDKLKELRKSKKLTQQFLADYLGIVNSAYSMYESGKREISVANLKKLSDFYNVPIDYFYTRETNIENSCPINLDNSTVKIPVLGVVPAGIPIEAIENILDYEEIPKSLARTGTFFAFKISGDSMYPRYLDGDIIICKQQDFVKNGGEAIVYVNSDYETTFKRIIFKEKTVELESYNPMYPTMSIEKELLNVLAVPVELRRKMT